LYGLWAATGNLVLKEWAQGLMDFVIWMHAGGGLWHNFILDWDGTRNVDGPTSAPGVNFWQARATCALAELQPVLSEVCRRDLLTQALAAANTASPPSDVRAVHALSLLAALERAPDRKLMRCLPARRNVDELA
jgi:hypothetical protein